MYTSFLKEKFGHEQFREKQLGIIRQVVEKKRDILGIMFTGLGKSLCFQYIPTYLNKTALVISPLIALMNDQKLKLDSLGIPSCCLNSTTPKRATVIKEIMNNSYRLVYITPEYVMHHLDFIEDLVRLDIICLITIDEAHIISNWGTNFRPEYRELHILKKLAPKIPIMALTATATPKVQEDIINILELNKPFVVKTTFNRVNLNIIIQYKTDKGNDLLHHLKNSESTIIYAKTHKDTESISSFLQKKGVLCDFYHGGMNSSDREIVHNKFIDGTISCVVATIAFGMGIDIPIRKVIHYCVSEDIESYYQEIGRAGRDGKDATCIMYYGNQDLNMANFLISQIPNEDVKKQKLIMFKNMVNYLGSKICRKKYILNYFGEELLESCNKCDICARNISTIENTDVQVDVTLDTTNIINTIKLVKGKYGAGMIVNILIGKIKDKKDYLKNLSTFKKYLYSDEKYLSTLIKILTSEGYLKVTFGTGFYNSIDYTNLAATTKTFIIPVPISIISLFNKDIPKTIPTKDKTIPTKDKIITPKIKPLKKDTIEHVSIKESNTNILSIYLNGSTLSEIAKNMNKTTQSIEGMIVKEYKKSPLINYNNFGVTDIDYKHIISQIATKKLGEIKKSSNLNYLQIKICIAHSKR